MKYLISFLLLACFAIPASADIPNLLQMVDYMGVDYPAAVQDGQVVNAAEFSEMQEFAHRIQTGIADLPPADGRADLNDMANALAQAVDGHAAPRKIAQLTRDIREALMANYDVVLTPRTPPDPGTAANLYQAQCGSCHGSEGYGDGPAAAALDPAPTNFHDRERAEQRSLYGLFNTITLGVEGTAMTGHPKMSDAERWSLAFYVGAMGMPEDKIAAGKSAFEKHPITLKEAVTQTPRQLAESVEDGGAIATWLRKNPGALFSSKGGALHVAEQGLKASLEAWRNGETRAAQQQAIRAYLEGFELVEAPLANVDNKLMRDTESAMMAYRQALQQNAPMEQVQARYDDAVALLHKSGDLLTSSTLSPTVAFSGSLIILLREGLEAILVLAAVIAFLSRSGRQDALKYVHGGWVLALIAGGATWLASAYLIDISGAAREMTEGVAALVAAVILLYVGFWMHRNADARRWNQFLQEKMRAALTSRTLWTLCLVSFLAVYREIFETILFYQALWVQIDEGSQASVVYGAVLALALLVFITWLFTRFSVRLPLKQFFLGSALLMVVLAFIFSGKGVAALQEAGKLPSNPVSFPTIDLLGIYPNLEALALQGLVLLLAAIAVMYERFNRRAVTP